MSIEEEKEIEKLLELMEQEIENNKQKKLIFNPYIRFDAEMTKLLIDANKSIALLNGLFSRISDLEPLKGMFIIKEMISSSAICGLNCTVNYVLNDANKYKDDASLIMRYINVFKTTIERCPKEPITIQFIIDIHTGLKNIIDAYYVEKSEFRDESLRYYPIKETSPQDIEKELNGLVKYIDSSKPYDYLIAAALILYQFEKIQPFNGLNEITSMIIVLAYLIREKVISFPILFLSRFIRANVAFFREQQIKVYNTGKFEEWVKFFLENVIQTANKGIQIIDMILALKEKNKAKLKGNKLEHKLSKVLTYIEYHPIVDIKKAAIDLDIAYNTMAKYLEILYDLQIIALYDSPQRKMYKYTNYLAIIDV